MSRDTDISDYDQHVVREIVDTTPALDRVASRLSQYSKDAVTDNGGVLGNRYPRVTDNDHGNSVATDTMETVMTEEPNSRASMQEMTLEDGERLFQDRYPEGGKVAWRVVLGSFLGLTAAFGLVNALGAIQARLEENELQSYSSSQVSWIFSVYLFCFFFCQIQVGPIFDSYGPYYLVASGTVFHVTGLMMTSLCTKYYQFILAFGLLCGVGCALIVTPFIAVIGHWFDLKRGLATGVATMGGSLGAVIFPVMLRSLYSKLGFPWAIRVLGFLSLTTLSLGLVLVKPRLDRQPLRLNPRYLIDFKALNDKRYLFLCIAVFLVEWSLLTGVTYITSFSIANGMSQSSAYLLLTLYNVAGIPGRVLAGYLADKFGRFNTFIGSSVLAIIANLALWLPVGKYFGGMTAFVLVYGLATGTVMSVTPVCCGQICRTEDYGKRYGTLYFVSSFAPLFGIPLSGTLIKGSSYNGLIALCGGLYLGTVLFLIASRYAAVGFKLCKF